MFTSDSESDIRSNMVETGAKPRVSFVRQQVTRLGRSLTTPLLPDDYFALVKPRWSTRELTGKVVRVRRERGNTATIVVKPNFSWPTHMPGQYLRIGMEINGVRHWRGYSITSDPDHSQGGVRNNGNKHHGGRQ